MGNQLEDIHNVALAKLLNRESDMKALPLERLASGGVGDVVITMQGGALNGIRVILEGKNSSPGLSKADDAIQQAERRLRDDDCDAAAAVLYPQGADHGFSVALDSEIYYARTDGGWIGTTPADMPQIIKQLAREIDGTDLAAKNLRRVLIAAEKKITDSDIKKMSETAEIIIPLEPQQHSFGNDISRFNETHKEWRKQKTHASMRVLLVLFAASMLHARLDKYFDTSGSKPIFDARTGDKARFKGNWPPGTLKDCINAKDTVQALLDSWDLILAKDYRPIYESAREILLSSGSLDAVSQKAIEDVVRHAQSVQASFVASNHDLLGRIFHWILETSKNDGSFYTSTAAATLLAELAIEDNQRRHLTSLRILDPACGTGTLLMAASERIHKLCGSEMSHTSKTLVEDVLHGWDVNITAAHMAATTLGLMSPEVSFDKMNIHLLTLGFDAQDNARAGSLELMKDDAHTRLWSSRASRQISEKEQQREEESISKEDRFNIILMNPPYTTDSKRHDQLGKAEEPVKDREEELMRGLSVTRNHTGGMFLMLAEHLLGEDGNTLAFVYPLAGTDAPSMSKVWKHLFEKFELEYVISAPDPERFAFSENTDICEMLVVMRRKNPEAPRLNAQFVRLAKNPARPSEALSVVADIQAGKSDNFCVDIIQWPHHRVEAGDWSPVKFYSAYLVDKTREWFAEDSQKLFCEMKEIAEVGPAGRRIMDAFKHASKPDKTGRVCLWFNNQTEETKNGKLPKRSMRQSHDTYIHAKSGKKNYAEKKWDERGRLFIPEKARTTTASTFAVLAEEPCVGVHWISVKHKDTAKQNGKQNAVCSGGEKPSSSQQQLKGTQQTDTAGWHYGCDWEKAMCAYLNSTIGILALLYAGSPNVLGRTEPSLQALRSIPVPKLNEEQTAELADAYDKHRNKTLEPLKQPCDTRKQLDEAVASALRIEAEQIIAARRELSQEPQITNLRYGETEPEDS